MKCPFCGDMNRVPGESGGDDLPSASASEQEIRQLHPAMFRAHPFRAAAVFILLGLGAWLTISAKFSDGMPGWVGWPGLVILLTGIGWWIAWYVGSHLWIKVHISNKRTTRRSGIVRRHTSEVLHDHIRNIEIRQNFLQRIMNVGYLGISSSGQDGIEIEVRDIPKPYEIKALIDRYRDM